ncbi:NADPH-dependent FMN reductase [Kangiella shandongensis]|uniref:NADPH-dependent FMN reductase n=1 Tax=Kangiella shandongensis TaxID=2763258 RepID=UPI001CBEE0B1|nr:NADPH-dependent FMN reductase [Kangiella shandongensis]
MKIFAFCASNNSESINKKLLEESCRNFQNHEVKFKVMNDFDLPIFSQDLERDNHTYPQAAQTFLDLTADNDAIVIATPEHNSSIPAAFKNIVDWCSRSPNLNGEKIFRNKPVLLLSTSPGGRGGSTNLKHLETIMPWWGADIRFSLSIPSFFEHFDQSEASFDKETKEKVQGVSTQFLDSLQN